MRRAGEVSAGRCSGCRYHAKRAARSPKAPAWLRAGVPGGRATPASALARHGRAVLVGGVPGMADGLELARSNPVLWAALLLAELYGLWNLATLAWLTWDVTPRTRPDVRR